MKIKRPRRFVQVRMFELYLLKGTVWTGNVVRIIDRTVDEPENK